MPALQKFKIFATHCAAINISTQSPTTSPIFHLRRPRRRKTLRTLLARRSQISDSDPESIHHHPRPRPLTNTTSKPLQKRSKLKDLFSSSSSSSSPTSVTHRGHDDDDDDDDDQKKMTGRGVGPLRSDREVGPVVVRSVVQPFRFRNRLLLRKPWRPVLSTIHEIQD